MSTYHNKIYFYKVDECQSRIENSEFFSLNPETQKAAYERAKAKLIEDLIQYAFALNEFENTSYGEQIWELVLNCLKYYDPSSGYPFLHYFNKALSNEKEKWKAIAYYEDRTVGLGIPKEKLSSVFAHMKWAEKECIGTHSLEFIELVSDDLGISTEEAIIIIGILENGVVSEVATNKENEKFNLFDVVAHSKDEKLETIPGGTIMEAIDIKKYLVIFEKEYLKLQGRTQRVIGKILTSKLASLTFTNQEIYHHLKDCAFYDHEIYIMCVKNNDSLLDTEIANMLGMKDSSISRCWQSFLKKFEKE